MTTPGYDRRPVALITGGSRGIGLESARQLQAAGYDLVLVARSRDRLEQVADELGARWYTADCADEAAVQLVAEQAGPVDVVVHAAGVLVARRSRRMDAAGFEDVLHQNLTSAYVISRTFGTSMAPGSRIVLIASTAAIDPMSYLSAYGAAKAGVVTMSRAMRLELESEGIAIHVVLPGTVDTAMMERNEVRRASLLPEDVASTVVWLASLPHRVRVDEIVMRPAETSPFAHHVEVTVPPRDEDPPGGTSGS